MFQRRDRLNGNEGSNSCVDGTTIRLEMPSKKAKTSSCSSVSSGSPPSSDGCTSRQLRNQAEKQRRDKLNSYINELAVLVPMISRSSKRMDKTSILRLSAAQLRLYYSPLSTRNSKRRLSWKVNSLQAEHVNDLLMVIEGFIVAASLSGKIIFASQSVEKFLGHQDIEMIGLSLFSFIHPADIEHVMESLKKLSSSKEQNGKSEARCSFFARMKERCQHRSEVIGYQPMKFNCCVNYDDEAPTLQHTSTTLRKSKTSAVRETIGGWILKFFIKPVKVSPNNELSITEAFRDEYVTRHDTLGHILYADHRISTITGHLPDEVLGKSAFDYITMEDRQVALFAQKMMFSSSNGTGMIVYRLHTRNSTSVYLKSLGHLEYDSTNKKISHFVCINKLLCEEEGKEELKKFIARYSPRINGAIEMSEMASQSSFAAIDECEFEELSPLHVISSVETSPSSVEVISPRHMLTNGSGVLEAHDVGSPYYVPTKKMPEMNDPLRNIQSASSPTLFSPQNGCFQKSAVVDDSFTVDLPQDGHTDIGMNFNGRKRSFGDFIPNETNSSLSRYLHQTKHYRYDCGKNLPPNESSDLTLANGVADLCTDVVGLTWKNLRDNASLPQVNPTDYPANSLDLATTDVSAQWCNEPNANFIPDDTYLLSTLDFDDLSAQFFTN